jgi:hypothetical protein
LNIAWGCERSNTDLAPDTFTINCGDLADDKFAQSASSSFADNLAKTVEKTLGPKPEKQ